MALYEISQGHFAYASVVLEGFEGGAEDEVFLFVFNADRGTVLVAGHNSAPGVRSFLPPAGSGVLDFTWDPEVTRSIPAGDYTMQWCTGTLEQPEIVRTDTMRVHKSGAWRQETKYSGWK